MKPTVRERKRPGILDGAKLNNIRNQLGLGPEDFLEILDVTTPRSVFRVFSGETAIADIFLIEDLAKMLRCRPIDLLKDSVIDLLDMRSAKTKLIPCAGFISSDNDNLPESLSDLPQKGALNIDANLPDDCYYINMKGASCSPKFNQDDMIIASQSLPWEPGDTVIVKTNKVGDCAWVRSIDHGREKGTIILYAYNSSFPPIVLRSEGPQNEILFIHKVIQAVYK